MKKTGRPLQVRDRAWVENRVERVTESGCWVWMGDINKQGYGYVTTRQGLPGHPRVRVRAHRFVYELYVGGLPPATDLLHKCDVRCCVSPQHLKPGTHSDNMRQMAERGRAAQARLTPAQVHTIRALALGGMRALEISTRYPINRWAIRRIIRRKDYAWV